MGSFSVEYTAEYKSMIKWRIKANREKTETPTCLKKPISHEKGSPLFFAKNGPATWSN